MFTARHLGKLFGFAALAGTLSVSAAIAAPSETLKEQVRLMAGDCCMDTASLQHYLLSVTGLPTQLGETEPYGGNTDFAKHVVERFINNDYQDTEGYRQATTGLSTETQAAQLELLEYALSQIPADQPTDTLTARFAEQLARAAQDNPAPGFAERFSIFLRQQGAPDQDALILSLFSAEEAEAVRTGLQAVAALRNDKE